ncbi:MAG: UDP-galactopyranose mutase [Actinomycetia bacterium]|nr:UDP-galactopyranose mutase [Actinomycetes bacterium]
MLQPPSDDELAGCDAIVVGAGFAGAVIAREIAERGGRKVAVIERRPHIAGNAYDHSDRQGVLIHKYGPHIYHTNSERVHTFLSRFTEWYDYQHEVLASVHGKYIPVPFNLNSIAASFPADKAAAYRDALLGSYALGSKVGILQLRRSDQELLRELAEYVYEHVFLHYTMKQWGLAPDEIDPEVTARVPVLVDTDNRYFQDRYQGMPQNGYTPLFERLLDHPNITVYLGLDAISRLHFDVQEGQAKALDFGSLPYFGTVVYTGALDELAGWRYGILPYRSLDFVYRYYQQKHVQPCGTVNFTVSESYTRTTEYTWLTGQQLDVTTVAEEYPRAFEDTQAQIPYYPILTDANKQAYQRYVDFFAPLTNFRALGRLAEYRYYNMDAIVQRALGMADELLS